MILLRFAPGRIPAGKLRRLDQSYDRYDEADARRNLRNVDEKEIGYDEESEDLTVMISELVRRNSAISHISREPVASILNRKRMTYSH